MADFDPARRVTYYLHIAKTGGTSFRRFAYYNTPDSGFVDHLITGRLEANGEAVVADSERPEIAALTATIRGHTAGRLFVASNVPYGLHRRVDAPFNYLTFLRDPVARARSYWRFVYANRDGGPLWREWESLRLDPELILNHPSGAAMRNDQTRVVNGVARLALGRDDGLKAVDVLRGHFFFVGDFANYEADVRRLGGLLGWTFQPVPRVNVATPDSADSIPRGFAEVVQAHNAADLALYEWLRSGR